MSDKHVRVLVVDDSAEARAAIGEVVVQAGGFELVGSVSSGREALDLLPTVEPGLVLLDVRMHGLNGIETTRLIRESGARTAVVLVSALHRSQLPEGVSTCGADVVLHKSEISPRRLAAVWRELQANPAAA